MDVPAQITLRSKKLGLLIRDMRQNERRSIEECAQAIGVTSEIFRDYEEAKRSPSLPEVELLIYFLKLPIQRLWSEVILSASAAPAGSLDLVKLVGVRQRMIGALLRQEREQVNLTLPELAQKTGLASAELEASELGEKPIPLPVLEAIVGAINGRLEKFFDQSGPVGAWLTSKNATEKFLELPKEIQEFVCQPINRPYLELAIKLSEMTSDRLRSVAEGLLDITL